MGDAGPGVEAGSEQGRPGGGWGIGVLAQRSGVTVRTLRHYDQTGLLRPSRRDPAGRRVYDRDDVERLYRVLALRRLRFSLAQIRSLLDEPDWDTAAMVARHSAETDRALAATARLSTLLRSLSAQITATGDPSPDQLFTTMEEMTMLETPIRTTTTQLVCDDLRAAHAHLVEVFGLIPGELEVDADGRAVHGEVFGLIPGELEVDADGRAVHGEVFAGDRSIWLHPAGEGYRSPRSLGAVSSIVVVEVDDADAHHARALQHGAQVVKAPVDQPYGVREYGARDLEGHLWYFHSPLD